MIVLIRLTGSVTGRGLGPLVDALPLKGCGSGTSGGAGCSSSTVRSTVLIIDCTTIPIDAHRNGLPHTRMPHKLTPVELMTGGWMYK